MSVVPFYAAQDRLFATAREYLKKEHRFESFVTIYADAIPEEVPISTQAIQEPGMPRAFGAVLSTDPKNVLWMYHYTLTNPAAAAAFRRIMEQGRTNQFFAGAAKALCSGLKIDPKDILAGFLTVLCRNVKATALIKIDEVYFQNVMSEKEAAKQNRSLKDDPNAQEGLMSVLETPRLCRVLLQPFTRAPDAPFPITGFGELQEQTGEKGWAFEGRFSHFLVPEGELQ